MKKNDSPTLISPETLRRAPLPRPDEDGDKDDRGRVLVIGGTREMPGAVVLAAEAALRAGAGKLQIATGESVARLVAALVPESRVFALPETKTGSVAGSAVGKLEEHLRGVQAVLVGPGWTDEKAVARFVKSLLRCCGDACVVLDAGATGCLAAARDILHPLGGRAVITPHAGELANIYGADKEEISADQQRAARGAAAELRAVVALKGRETYIAAPGGVVYLNRAGNVGLATSGSGDVLSGVIAGLAARGAEPLTAAAWGVHLHALAGDRLAARVGRLGFLARELPAEIPRLLTELER